MLTYAGASVESVSGDRSVNGEELMALLEKAWEEGKEAAEKRLAFERCVCVSVCLCVSMCMCINVSVWAGGAAWLD